MKTNPRLLFFFIIILTIFTVLVNLPTLPILQKKQLSFRTGLDLSGGTSLTLKADMSEIQSEKRAEALNSAKTIIERRVNLFGVAEPVVQTSRTNRDDRIIVELPGLTNLNQVKELVGTTAKLIFWEEVGTQSAQILKQSDYPLNLPAGYKKTNLGGADLKEASVGFNQNTGKPEVLLSFTSQGSQKFEVITKRTVGKRLAIVLDSLAIEVPTVNEPILGGNAQITGGFTLASAKTLVTQLNAGALPVPLEILQSHVIEPTLGSESLRKSLFAGVLGFVIIVFFMSVLYGKKGILASLALLIYTLVVLSIFKLSTLTPYAITLTLSGIAGFILSIGMAVDANILIFERMKEEIRSGRAREMATELGFSRAWTSIRDSNISTLITSAILYKFGTGPVRGFALVLAIGVLVSMFSAIIITRTFLRITFRK